MQKNPSFDFQGFAFLPSLTNTGIRCQKPWPFVDRLSTLVHSFSKSDGLFAQGLDVWTMGMQQADLNGVLNSPTNDMLRKSQTLREVHEMDVIYHTSYDWNCGVYGLNTMAAVYVVSIT